MCSLSGIYRFPGSICNEEDFALVESSLAALEQRGPDQTFTHQVARRCVLGGNRLIVRGGRSVGAMPFVSQGVTACYNGELYNSSDYTDSEADGDAILPAYLEHRFELGAELDGEFAIAIWDATSQALLLARDHFGTKPLYFAFDRERLAWASSARLVARMTSREICGTKQGPAFRHTYAAQEPYTSFQGVWSVPPGHTLVVSGKALTLKPNANWPVPTGAPRHSVTNALWKSLRQRLTHSGPVAIPMSAGIDSGILAFAAKRLGIDYHIFSVTGVFGRETAEAPFIQQRLARLQPPSVTLIDCTERDYENALSTIFRDSYYDSEYLDNGAILTYCVAAAVGRAGLRVLIDGTGGDELFDGYEFRADLVCPDGWPPQQRHSLNSLYTTLPAYTMKSDRAGGHHSFEARFPYQSRDLLHSAAALQCVARKKPLRKFLLSEVDYGRPLTPDVSGKYGFSMRGHDAVAIRAKMSDAWRMTVAGATPRQPPRRFPFKIGCQTTLSDF